MTPEQQELYRKIEWRSTYTVPELYEAIDVTDVKYVVVRFRGRPRAIGLFTAKGDDIVVTGVLNHPDNLLSSEMIQQLAIGDRIITNSGKSVAKAAIQHAKENNFKNVTLEATTQRSIDSHKTIGFVEVPACG